MSKQRMVKIELDEMTVNVLQALVYQIEQQRKKARARISKKQNISSDQQLRLTLQDDE